MQHNKLKLKRLAIELGYNPITLSMHSKNQTTFKISIPRLLVNNLKWKEGELLDIRIIHGSTLILKKINQETLLKEQIE